MQKGISGLNGIKRFISGNNIRSCKDPRNKGKCEGFNHDAKAFIILYVEIKFTFI